MCRSHPIFCILPPHLLSAVSHRGSSKQRAWALRTMSVDSTFRALRASQAAPLTAGRRRRPPQVTEGEKQRTICTARNEETLPGAIVRIEGAPASGDAAVDEAYDGLGATFDLYWEVYERNSIDDEGLPLDATVHYGARLRQRLLERPADGLRRRRRRAVQPLHDRDRRDRPRADPRRHPGRGAACLLLASRARSTSRSPTCSARWSSSTLLGQTATQADWLIGAGLFTGKREGRGAALDEGARHRLRRPGARQGSAARAHARLRAHLPGQRRRAHQLRHPQPRLLPRGAGRSAATPGRRPAASGTRPCATRDFGPTPASSASPR